MSRILGVLPALLVLVSPGLADSAKGKKYALLVGVNKYDSAKLTALKFAENDAEEMARLLNAKSAGFDGVRVLTSKRGEKNRADAPTAANVRAAVKELLKGKNRNDTVLVAFA